MDGEPGKGPTFPSCQKLPVNSMVLAAKHKPCCAKLVLSGVAYSGALGQKIEVHF